MAARMAQPGNADALAERQPMNAVSQAFHQPDDLVSRDYGQGGIGEFAVDQMEIGAADGAGFDAQPYLSRPRLRIGHISKFEGPIGRLQHHSAHASLLVRQILVSHRTSTGSTSRFDEAGPGQKDLIQNKVPEAAVVEKKTNRDKGDYP